MFRLTLLPYKGNCSGVKFSIVPHIVRTVYLRISICLNLQRPLRGRRFADEEQAKKAVHDWLRTLSKEFSDAFSKLVDSWTKCVETLQRDYIET
jgi:hypothetical protein